MMETSQARLLLLAILFFGGSWVIPVSGYFLAPVVLIGQSGALLAFINRRFAFINRKWDMLLLVVTTVVAGWIFVESLQAFRPETLSSLAICVMALIGLLVAVVVILVDLGETQEGIFGKLVPPFLFGVMFLFAWEVLISAFAVPQVLLPAPSIVWETIIDKWDILWSDFRVTFLRAAIIGFLLGNGAGFLTALAIDRSPFLQRGLLPFGNLVSAVPIVGIAPIMVMWFGFGWQSKTAVIVVMIFFPMLVNALTGLQSSERMALDLMKSYGAGYWRQMWALRLPNALPFIFNALKVNSTLALIGAIVAEFFGSPIAGMGFRISVEVGRLNVAMVWATIAVAAVAGSGSYILLTAAEKTLTHWHPSYRQK